MEKFSISGTCGIEREPSFGSMVLDKQKSLTVETESIEDENKGESNDPNEGDTRMETVLDIKTSSSTELSLKGNNEGNTPLYIAAENGNSEIVRAILKSASNHLVALNVDSCFDSFHIAAELGHADVMKELLRSFPALVTTTDPSNTTALYTAASKGHINVVNHLTEIDESIARIARSDGKTALHIAAKVGHLEVVISLLSKDPSLGSICDTKGQTALHMAVKGTNEEIVQEVVKVSPSLVNLADNKGNTPLHTATRKGHPQIIQTLLCFPMTNVNASNNAGETALRIAEKYFNEEICTLLREAGGSLTSRREELKETEKTIQIEGDHLHEVNMIKQEITSQLCKSQRIQTNVEELKKKVKKMTESGLSKANSSNIVVATLIFSCAFAAIFQIPGGSTSSAGDGYANGQAYIAYNSMFGVFFLSNTLALFVSLAVVLAQTTLIVVDKKAMKWMVFVINKLMWLCCLSMSVSFVSLAYVVVPREDWWLAWSSLAIAILLLISTLGIMCYLVITHRIQRKKLKRQIKKAMPGIKIKKKKKNLCIFVSRLGYPSVLPS